jgi:hypothetical protein
MANRKRHCAVTVANALHDSRAARAELAARGYHAKYIGAGWVVNGVYFATARMAVNQLTKGESKCN